MDCFTFAFVIERNVMRKLILFIGLMFSYCLSMFSQTYDERISRAMDAVEKDSLQLAEQLLKDALNADPANMKNALLLSNLGTIQRRMGKNKEAIESYTLAINKTPFSVTMLLNRASLYLELDYLEKAYSDYCNVIDLDKTNQEALQFRAYIYMRKRQYNEARADYRALLEENPRNKTARIGIVMVNQKDKRFQEALEILNLLITDYPKDVSLLKARAEIEVEMNALDLALLDLENAAKLAPNDTDVYVMCGDIYMEQNKHREAYVAYEKAIELGVPRPQLQDRLKASKKR